MTALDMLALLWEQGGRCYYSGVPLAFLERLTHWRWSLERLDTSLGYVKGNVVLVACEFNVRSRNRYAQWSRAKAEEIWEPFDWSVLPVDNHRALASIQT